MTKEMENVCKVIISLIGFVFILKYGSRCMPFASVITVAALYLVFYLYYAYYIVEKLRITDKCSRYINYAVLAMLAVIVIVSDIVVNKYALNVDRWSALTNTISNLMSGTYPYYAVTHSGNHCSTMPAWMFFHIPFYLIGKIGFSIIVCLLAFSYAVKKSYGSSVLCKILFLLLLCPSFWYEIITVSDLQSNLFLVAAFVCYIVNHIEKLREKVVCVSIITGLFLSTRLTVCFPLFFALFPFWWSLGLRSKLLCLLTILATYGLLIVPFVFWHGDMSCFMESNPYQIQLIQYDLPSIILIVIVSVCLLCIVWRRRVLVYAASAISLFVFILSVFASQFVKSGFTDNLLSYHYDITYLAQAIPFALLAVATKKNEVAAKQFEQIPILRRDDISRPKDYTKDLITTQENPQTL